MYYRSFNKIIGAIALCILSISTVQAKEISINFIANASVRITDGEHVLFTDFPYVSGAYGHMEFTYPYFVEQDNNVSTLITSRMTDHFDPEVFMTLGWKVFAPAEVAGDIEKRYVELKSARDRVVEELEKERAINQALNPNQEIETILPAPISEPDVVVVQENLLHGPMQISAIRTKSAQTEHYSYILNWEGKKIYFSGDTGDVEHLKNLPETDIAFITPWLFENARKGGALPNTKKIVIYQHRVGEIVPSCFDCVIPEKGEFISFD